MFRILIRLAIAALVINAAWRVGSVYWRFYQFEDRLQEIAQFGERKNDKALCGQAMESAGNIGVPVEADDVTVRRGANPTFNCSKGFEAVSGATGAEPAAKIFIDAAYTDVLPLFPGFTYPWPMKASANAWVRP